MLSMLADIGSSLRSFFIQLTSALGFDLLFIIALGVELFFVFLFVLKTAFSYELRLRRSLDKINSWLFKHKKIDQNNVKEFNDLVKKGPKRVVYYWQQFILFREKEPTYYMSLDNLVEKPLKSSSYANNIRNINILTIIWTSVVLFLSIAYQTSISGSTLRIEELMGALILPILILFIGLIASMLLRAKKTSNLDEIYNIYHLFARFMNNATADLPSYIDYDLLFSPKEIEKGNPQLREYYEARARKAKEEFEKAKQSDIAYVEYNFRDAGVDGSLVLERAMKESETFMNKKSSTLAKIAHVDAQKEALKRNYENVQKDLQRKIQTSKENIQKLIQQQEATTNRMEVGFLRKQQEQEISKQETLQNEYDQEETRYAVSNEELNQEIAGLQKQLDEAQDDVERAMVAEYQTFYEKIMKNAYEEAQKRVINEKNELKKEKDNCEKELIVVQTQIKRLIDENETLRARLNEPVPTEEVKIEEAPAQEQAPAGKYDENGNYVYEDGSYHDPNGLFHDIDGKIYDINGNLLREPEDDKPEIAEVGQPTQTVEESVQEEPQVAGMVVEEVSAEDLGLASTPVEEPVVEEPTQPAVEEATTEENKTEQAVEEPEKKKRGRPRKIVEEPLEPKEPKKRGRPRKVVEEPVALIEAPEEVQKLEFTEPVEEKKVEEEPAKKTNTVKKTTSENKPATKQTKKTVEKKEEAPVDYSAMLSEKDGLPKTKKATPAKKSTTAKTTTRTRSTAAQKAAAAKPETAEDAPKKKRPVSRIKKTTTSSTSTAKKTTTKKTTTEKKEEIDLVSLAKINKMITEEEKRLSKMKALVNSEITDALNATETKEINDEREEIMKAVEALKNKAAEAKEEGKSDQELASINTRLEALIKEISELNKK